MKNYRAMLVRRNEQALAANPQPKEEPMSMIDYQNKLALQRWRRRMEKYRRVS